MENELDIFRKREEKKKKKLINPVDYPKYNKGRAGLEKRENKEGLLMNWQKSNTENL